MQGPKADKLAEQSRFKVKSSSFMPTSFFYNSLPSTLQGLKFPAGLEFGPFVKLPFSSYLLLQTSLFIFTIYSVSTKR